MKNTFFRSEKFLSQKQIEPNYKKYDFVCTEFQDPDSYVKTKMIYCARVLKESTVIGKMVFYDIRKRNSLFFPGLVW